MKRIFSLGLLSAGVLATSLTFAGSTFTKAQVAQIQKITHDYLVQNPQVLMEVSQALQMQQMKTTQEAGVKEAQQNTEELFRNKNDIVTGNTNGTVTLVEFFDYLCPLCRDMAKPVENLVKANPNLRVVYKDLIVHGQPALLAAEAAYAASQQGKYIEFHNAILESSDQTFDETLMKKYAMQVGLNLTKFQADIKTYRSTVDRMAEANGQLAQKLQLLGTPTFFIAKTDANSSYLIEMAPGKTTQADLQQMIDKVK